MKTLEELRNDLHEANKVYEKFRRDNSRELTAEEKKKDPDYPVMKKIETKAHVFELTADKLDEFNTIHKALEAARKKHRIAMVKERQNK
jgi:hypothetical protein